jgi:MscS family membrane protein
MRKTPLPKSLKPKDASVGDSFPSEENGLKFRMSLWAGRLRLPAVTLLIAALFFTPGMIHSGRAGWAKRDPQGERAVVKQSPDSTVKVEVEAAQPETGRPPGKKPAATVTVQVDAKPKKDPEKGAARILPAPDKQIAPVETEAIDKAGRELGKKIETLGKSAACLVGQWVNRPAFHGITWVKLLFCLLMLVSVFLIDRLFGRLIAWRLRRISAEEKSAPWRAVALQALHGPVRLFIYVYGSYAAFSPLFVHFEESFGPSALHAVAEKAADIGGGLAMVWFAFGLVKLVDVRVGKKAKALDGEVDDLAASILGKTLRFVVAAVGGILILQNLSGVELGPVIASLGIGGLAIALAAKEPLSNIFGTFTVLFDKPFKVGDWIRIDGEDGVVESVGYRSTRVRTWDGHLVSVPNQKIVNSSVDNVSQSSHLRWHTTLALSHSTSAIKLERAVDLIRAILADHDGMRDDRPPRVYVDGFSEWGVNIVIYAYYHPASFWGVRDLVHKTCLEIKRRFEAEGIEFVFQPHSDASGDSVYRFDGDPSRNPKPHPAYQAMTLAHSRGNQMGFRAPDEDAAEPPTAR